MKAPDDDPRDGIERKLCDAEDLTSIGGPPVRKWIPSFFGLLAVALLPWTLWLTQNLPSRHLSLHWDVAWGGFDLALASALGATAVAALRRSPWLEGAAVAAGTLLLVDAWFDVVTSSGSEVGVAVAEAVVFEIPLAILSFWIARDAERFFERVAWCLGAARRLRQSVRPSSPS